MKQAVAGGELRDVGRLGVGVLRPPAQCSPPLGRLLRRGRGRRSPAQVHQADVRGAQGDLRDRPGRRVQLGGLLPQGTRRQDTSGSRNFCWERRSQPLLAVS